MPQLSYPITSDGLVVPCMIGLDDSDMAALIQAGLPIPAPLQVIGVLDTGSDVTCVDSRLVKHFGLPVAAQASSSTATGSMSVKMYAVSLSLAPADGSAQPLFTHPQLLVMELSHPIPPIEVIIGRDVILQCDTLIEGRKGLFTLTF